MTGIPRSDKLNKVAFIPLAAAKLFGATDAKADLIGAQVTIGAYCCTSPTAPDLFSNVRTGTVPVSFPVGSLFSTTTLQIFPVGDYCIGRPNYPVIHVEWQGDERQLQRRRT